MCASLKRRRCVSGVGFTPRMIKDKCVAYAPRAAMTSRPMTIDEGNASITSLVSHTDNCY
jgi:hypothetical protein